MSKDNSKLSIHPTTDLCVDLKLYTREPGRMDVGTYHGGVITRDNETHYTFIEDAPVEERTSGPRNPHVYRGRRINVNRRADGTLYPTFNRPRFTKGFTFQNFCREAAEELLMVAGLLGKKGK